MPGEDPHSDRFYKSLISEIRRSRRPVTIMFTDVEGSTHYWDAHGDVKGRLMVDLHNRLICPVITRYRGKVVKHVGDAIMASFTSPGNALKAAIGIQQILHQRRSKEGSLLPKVRVGVHTGKALVESDDVFGDMVNVAARVGDYAKGCEICVSGSTAAKVKKKAFKLAKTGSFLPKGKRKPITIYECQWRAHPSLIDDVDERRPLPLIRRQKLELAGYFLAAMGVFYFLCHRYARHLALDNERLAVLARKLWAANLSISLVLAAVAAAALGLLVWRKARSSQLPFRILKGGFGFAVAFTLFYLPAEFLPLDIGPKWDEEIDGARHPFVRVEQDEVGVHQEPVQTSPTVGRANAGDILILATVADKGKRSWFKVLLDRDVYGWIPEEVPPTIGEPGRRLATITEFSFKYRDLYALAAGLLGFLWGALSFRIRPA